MRAGRRTPNRAAAPVCLAALAVEPGTYRADQETALTFFRERCGTVISPRSMTLLEGFLRHPSIAGRDFAFDDPAVLLSEDQDAKIARFTTQAVDLAARAAQRALGEAGLRPEDISALVVNTCTGYVCPGLSTYLLERLALPPATDLYDLVGGGCAGALPNLDLGRSILADGRGGAVLAVAVEITSATYQMGDDVSLLLSNALFGDGAAAAILRKGVGDLRIVASRGVCRPEHREQIRYVYSGGQLHNRLSSRLATLVAEAAAEVVTTLLVDTGIEVGDVAHWALHTGGERIIDAVGGTLGLTEERLAPTRAVLRKHGNMSSPTALFVLREILDRGIAPGEWCLLLAYGAGLSARAILLRRD